MKNEVRFFYMRDPENPDRLVTTARRWANEERTVIEVAFAVNNPTSGWRREYYHDPVWIEGDKPSKPRGRQIATGRLMKHPFVVELGGRRQLTAICEMLQSRPEPILTESGEQERDGHGKLLFRPSEAWWAAYNGLKNFQKMVVPYLNVFEELPDITLSNFLPKKSLKMKIDGRLLC